MSKNRTKDAGKQVYGQVANEGKSNSMRPLADHSSPFTHHLANHWPEYLIEGWALGMFMISASAFTILFEYPNSFVQQAIGNGDLRRMFVGIAMGLTAMALIYSPWGQRSGAHMNPAITLAFLRLKKIDVWNACFYIVAQCIGGTLGVLMVAWLWPTSMAAPEVNYIVTVPGVQGAAVAFVAELAISALLVFIVLSISNSARYTKYTGAVAGFLVAAFITFEAPLSGMSINPARSLASALPSGIWTDFWIYLTAPVIGMQAGALLFAANSRRSASCGKLLHPDNQRCIHCGYEPADVIGD